METVALYRNLLVHVTLPETLFNLAIHFLEGNVLIKQIVIVTVFKLIQSVLKHSK